MTVAVVGLWHLGCVTAACLAEAGHDVIAYDPQAENIAALQQGQAPLFEPGLNVLLQRGIENKKLCFTSTPSTLATANILWITFDTPVDDHDKADSDGVIQHIAALFPHLQSHTL